MSTTLGTKLARTAFHIDDVRVRNKGATLALKYTHLPNYLSVCAELLRTHAPSTDVVSSQTLVYGKRGLRITDMYPVGNYAFRITFSDHHDAGIYTYDYLEHLTTNKWQISREYLRRLKNNNKKRVLKQQKQYFF